jgi:hypothetical protein
MNVLAIQCDIFIEWQFYPIATEISCFTRSVSTVISQHAIKLIALRFDFGES